MNKPVMTRTEALEKASRAKELIDEASDLLHAIALASVPSIVSHRAYQCDKAARDASMDIFCNYVGLIDTIGREMEAD